jgi:cytochrome c-type biogenesis protein CcmH/NrfG
LTNRPAEAADAFAKAIGLGDTSAAAYAGYATALMQSGARDRARTVLRQGLHDWPGDPALKALERQAGAS